MPLARAYLRRRPMPVNATRFYLHRLLEWLLPAEFFVTARAYPIAKMLELAGLLIPNAAVLDGD